MDNRLWANWLIVFCPLEVDSSWVRCMDYKLDIYVWLFWVCPLEVDSSWVRCMDYKLDIYVWLFWVWHDTHIQNNLQHMYSPKCT